jgi:putative ABC transport system ATP-binding protein/lipoprotein-releasing system ATP-binding protein
MLDVEGLCKHYGTADQVVRAVDHVDLHVERADFVSIVGHSGSGKTTLLSLMGGLTRPTSGTVRVDGLDLWALSDAELARLRNRRVGFIYQFASLIPALTVLENVLLPAVFGGAPHPPRERAMTLLSTVGLADKARAYPGELSGGQQRRVAIARSFINEPAVILADEPTGDLDEETEAEIFDFFAAMNREQVAFVVATHSRELAGRASIRLRMDRGRLTPIEPTVPAFPDRRQSAGGLRSRPR